MSEYVSDYVSEYDFYVPSGPYVLTDEDRTGELMGDTHIIILLTTQYNHRVDDIVEHSRGDMHDMWCVVTLDTGFVFTVDRMTGDIEIEVLPGHTVTHRFENLNQFEQALIHWLA